MRGGEHCVPTKPYEEDTKKFCFRCLKKKRDASFPHFSMPEFLTVCLCMFDCMNLHYGMSLATMLSHLTFVMKNLLSLPLSSKELYVA